MARRTDSVIGRLVGLVLGVCFVIFWIGMAASHGAPIFFPLFGLVFLGVLVFNLGGSILKTLGEQSRNESAAVLTSPARLLAKRTEVKGHRNSHSTDYFATFGLESGERLELELEGKQFGLLTEGDQGELRYQGTWFLDFALTSPEEPERVAPVAESLVCEYCGGTNASGALKCASCGSGKLLPSESETAA